MRSETLNKPWRSFLSGLDLLLDHPADLHCIGGFAVSQYFGFGRETADLNVLSIAPQSMRAAVAAAAGRAPRFTRSIASASIRSPSRISRITAKPADASVASLEKLRLWIPEPRDLALTKLGRSNERGIRDMMFLAQAHGTNAGLAPDDAQYVDRGLLARGKVTLAKNQQIASRMP